MATLEKIYRAHVLNLRAVDTALERILRELNSSLARRDDKTSDALTKTAMLLLGGWAENRLRKLTTEPNGFSETDRDLIRRCGTQLDSWKKALELGFRRRHAIPRADLTTLPFTPRSHYNVLLETLNNDLRPIIEVRNKLAHGQWARTLTSENDAFAPEMMALISGENALTVKAKKRLLSNMAQLIHDLVAGNAAFERDFDTHFSNLENAKRDIRHRDFEDWVQGMRLKHQRGRRVRARVA